MSTLGQQNDAKGNRFRSFGNGIGREESLPYQTMCRLVLCQPDPKLESFGTKETQLRKCPHQILWASLWGIFLIGD